MRGQVATAIDTGRGARIAALLLTAACMVAVATAAATPAQAAIGYELDEATPSKSLDGAFPHGIAVDQSNRRIYVAIVLADGRTFAPGEVRRFESDLTAAGTFTTGGETFYAGVAVDPLTHGFYATRARLQTPFGAFGSSAIDPFSAAGTAGASFGFDDTWTLPQPAVDSSGNLYFPNAATDSVQVFDASGALQEEIDCGGCPGGTFGRPVSVALSSEDDLYVADLAPDRVVKLTSSEGSPYTFDSILQSGRGAVGVAVDPAADDILVADAPEGRDYHIVAYNSAGNQFDDFGAGLVPDTDPEFGGAILAPQIAADATSRKLYVGGVDEFHIFERTTIPPPTATIEPADPVGQIAATLKATVNANGHAALECDFEYTDEADFEANAFANATVIPCSNLPDGTVDTPLALDVSGLSPGTGYRYRLTATSNGGTDTSGAESFETLPEAAPTVTTEAPPAVGEETATLKGTVNPHGGSVSDCRFEFGATTAYGTEFPCPSLPGPVSSDVTQSRKVAELEPGTTYHYRLVVTSNAGTSEGEDIEFATVATPPPPPSDPPPATDPPPAIAPPPLATPAVPLPLSCRKGFRKKWVAGKPRCVRTCRRGFRLKRVRRKALCVPSCRRGFRAKRVRGKLRCVKTCNMRLRTKKATRKARARCKKRIRQAKRRQAKRRQAKRQQRRSR